MRMRIDRRWLAVLVAAASFTGSCMIPRSEMLREDVHHVRTDRALKARFGHEATACLPERLPADPATSAPRPSPEKADHTFRGDVSGMREHVFLVRSDDRHHYLERWDVGIAGVDWEILTVGWDWKVSCTIEQCALPDGLVCCYQECRDGGDRGMAYEAPDRFGCMNEAAGGVYQWFIDGMREAGVPGAEGCR
jgi:hypothetical protein